MRRLTFALLIATAAVVAACGDDDDSEDDPAVGQVGAVSENATYAFAEDGPDGLYDYLAEPVTAACTKEQLASALDGEPIPTGWRQTKDIEISDDGTATATVIVITEDGDIEQGWSFTQEGESWRITSVPGIEECA